MKITVAKETNPTVKAEEVGDPNLITPIVVPVSEKEAEEIMVPLSEVKALKPSIIDGPFLVVTETGTDRDLWADGIIILYEIPAATGTTADRLVTVTRRDGVMLTFPNPGVDTCYDFVSQKGYGLGDFDESLAEMGGSNVGYLVPWSSFSGLLHKFEPNS